VIDVFTAQARLRESMPFSLHHVEDLSRDSVVSALMLYTTYTSLQSGSI
jgi:hypothetical protein